MRIAVLHDAMGQSQTPDELDTLVQAEQVAGILNRLGHQSLRVPFSLDLSKTRERLGATRPELVFNLVEAVEGRGALIHLAPALLSHMGLPHTGAGQRAMTLSSDKVAAKAVLAAAGLPTPAWFDATCEQGFAPGRYLAKPAWEHGSRGIGDASLFFAPTLAGGRLRLGLRRDPGGGLFAEAFVQGREYAVALLQEGEAVRVLPVAEMVFARGSGEAVLDYAAKWLPESPAYQASSRSFESVDPELAARLCHVARRCWQAFGLAGYARVDFRVNGAGEPFVIDVNANPCLAADAGFMAAAARAGLDAEAVLARIVEAALGSCPRLAA